MPHPIVFAWRRLERWYVDNLPKEIYRFRPGANPKAVVEAEKALGVEFTDEVRESYLFHDGIERCGIGTYGYVIPLADVREQWEFLVKSKLDALEWPPSWVENPFHGEIKPVFWSTSRVPFTDNQDGNYVMIDFDPGPAGTRGQIIRHDRLAGPARILGKSLSEWLSAYVDDLEQGKYVFDADAETLIPEDEY